MGVAGSIPVGGSWYPFVDPVLPDLLFLNQTKYSVVKLHLDVKFQVPYVMFQDLFLAHAILELLVQCPGFQMLRPPCSRVPLVTRALLCRYAMKY